VKRLAFALVLATLALGGGSPALGVSSGLVISQVYGGGGNVGAPYTHDYIEIFNRGATTVILNDLSLQYASATGTGNFGSTTTQITEISGILAPGQYFLVQEASGTTPAPASNLPFPIFVDPTPIAMAAGAGKVALVDGNASLGCNGSSAPCSGAALARIIDLVGYGNANFFEGAAAAPTLSNTLAGFRNNGGCTETDDNGADFTAAAPNPRPQATDNLNECPTGDTAPSVTSTTPGSGATGVATTADVSITFSENVNVAGTWFSISCATSGPHTAVVSGGPPTFTLNPDTDFANSETCTVTIFASQVTDQDASDPPDTMAADYMFSFTTVGPPVAIHEIQGAAHVSPLAGQHVSGVHGIVTAKSTNGFWMQDPSPDANDATSEGIFVFTSSAPTVSVGDALSVMGTVSEFRPGGASSTNLSTTELTGATIAVQSSGNTLPTPTVIGTGGRIPPATTIEDDATGDVETSGVFDPATDGIDFYESLEGMRVQVNSPKAVGPRNDFGELPVVGDNGANASLFTSRGGLILRSTDANPERIILDDGLPSMTTPTVDVGDGFTGPAVGVLDYSFGNFKLEITQALTAASNNLARETTAAATAGQLAVATFNVENLDPGDGAAKFNELAHLIVDNLASPDLISVEEMQDNNGAVNDSVVDATVTLNTLVAAISAAGGPTYDYRQINPVDDQDGGEPGGNIRQVFLFRTDRGLAFVDAPGAGSTTANSVVAGPHLQYSPGRINPTNSAFNMSRKPLAGEFTFHGSRLFLIGNHFNSKGGDQPLFGHFQPLTLSSETQRTQQAQIVNDFVDAILAADANASVIVLGDLNDFDFSTPLATLQGSPNVLSNLYSTLPVAERYSYVFDGNSQALDHILASTHIAADLVVLDPVHVNAEFAQQASDHDPLVARFCADATAPTLTATASPSTLLPPNHTYRNVTVTISASDDSGASPTVTFVSATSNELDNAPGGSDGNTINDIVKLTDTTFRLRAERDENGTGRVYTITYRATDACGNTTTASATVTVPRRP
jgi:predicted extracellular nuclease